MDLHQKVVSYIKKYYPDVMINASLGENQDISEKRITSYKAGYLRGIPDLNIMEMNSKITPSLLNLKARRLEGFYHQHKKKI